MLVQNQQKPLPKINSKCAKEWQKNISTFKFFKYTAISDRDMKKSHIKKY